MKLQNVYSMYSMNQCKIKWLVSSHIQKHRQIFRTLSWSCLVFDMGTTSVLLSSACQHTGRLRLLAQFMLGHALTRHGAKKKLAGAMWVSEGGWGPRECPHPEAGCPHEETFFKIQLEFQKAASLGRGIRFGLQKAIGSHGRRRRDRQHGHGLLPEI